MTGVQGCGTVTAVEGGGPVQSEGADQEVVRKKVDLHSHASGEKKAIPEGQPCLTEVVRRVVAAYAPERVYLFGSHARGEAGPDSDYDLLVVVSDSAPPERRESRLAYQVLRGTGVAVDVIVVTRDYFEWMLGAAASLPATVEREGRLLYAA